MDLNERIARLLEPVPSIDECEENRHSDAFGWIGTRHDGWVPATFKESIDASMRVIEKRWPKCHVSMFWSDKRQEYVARISDIRTEADDREIGDGEGATRAEALALALCAALEAEVTP